MIEETPKAIEKTQIIAGETKKIAEYVAVPCSTEGKYELNTKITTIFGLESILEQNIDVNDCVNIQITPKVNEQAACGCTPVEYSFDVKNTGTFVETYNFGIEPYNEYASFSDDIIVLEPFETKTVSVFITLPCDVYGKENLTFYAETEGSRLMGSVPFSLLIEPCYDYTFEIQDSIDVCRYVEEKIPINIKNTAEIANSYTFDLEWAKFADLEYNWIFLWGGEQGYLNLSLDPGDIKEGSYDLIINSLSDRGEVALSKNLTINVEDCYGLEVSTFNKAKVVNCEGIEHVVEVYNPGTREENIAVNLTAPEFVSLLPFDSEIEAAIVVDKKAEELFGEFARLNKDVFPKDFV